MKDLVARWFALGFVAVLAVGCSTKKVEPPPPAASGVVAPAPPNATGAMAGGRARPPMVTPPAVPMDEELDPSEPSPPLVPDPGDDAGVTL